MIPDGKYAKFVVHGDIHQAVADFWSKLWSMDLDRKYSCDFEEYQNDCETNDAEIHIYISLN
jgi:predicted transcriptional regulator YdeE